MAEHLLQQGVASGHAAGDRQMGDDMAQQADHAERAGPAAIQPCQLPDHLQRSHEYEQHVEQRTRAHRGDDGNPLRGQRDDAPCLLVERRHQFALGKAYHVGAVDDVAGMLRQRGAGARQMRILVRQFQEIVDDGAALGAIVARKHRARARMQLFDRGQPQ